MMLTPHAPHAPYTPAPRHRGTLAGLVAPHGPAYNLNQSLQDLLPGKLHNLSTVSDAAMDTTINWYWRPSHR